MEHEGWSIIVKTVGIIVACLLCAPAQAEPPSKETKRAALLWAYEANGRSMTSWSAWDYATRQQLTMHPREIKPQPPQLQNPK